MDLFFIIVFLIQIMASHGLGLGSFEDELRTDLFSDYNRASLPSKHTLVSATLNLQKFVVKENSHSLKINTWVTLEWNDPRLKYSSDSYNVTEFVVDNELVWKPDFRLINNAHGMSQKNLESQKVFITPDGSVLWVSPAILYASCSIDVYYWPHDAHHCAAAFGSVLSHGYSYLEVKFSRSELTISDWRTRSLSITNTTHKFSFSQQPISVYTLFVLISRNPWSVVRIHALCIILSMLTMSVFILPPATGFKIVLAGILCISNAIAIFAASSIIRHSYSNTPIMVQILCCQFLLSSASLVLSTLNMCMTSTHHSTPMSHWFTKILHFTSILLCVRKYRNEETLDGMKNDNLIEMGEEGEGRAIPQPKSKMGEWMLLAAVLDRIFFVIFFSFFLFFMIQYSRVLR